MAAAQLTLSRHYRCIVRTTCFSALPGRLAAFLAGFAAIEAGFSVGVAVLGFCSTVVLAARFFVGAFFTGLVAGLLATSSGLTLTRAISLATVRSRSARVARGSPR